MKVKCIKKLLDNWQDEIDIFGGADQNFLEEGIEYFVYAITLLNNEVLYYIIEDDELKDIASYPVWYSHRHFEITDPSLPTDWIFKVSHNPGHGEPYLTFPEWINEPSFYERMIEDFSSRENNIFQEYRSKYLTNKVKSSIVNNNENSSK